MKHLKSYSQYNLNLPIIESGDKENFDLIFNSLYKNHLSINEQMILESDFEMINETWFSDLVI